MASSSDIPGPNSNPLLRTGTTDHNESTAKDLAVPVPEYLQEIHATLRRTEEAYANGNLAACVSNAEEGLAILRLPIPALAKAPVPPHYEIYFRCFRHL